MCLRRLLCVRIEIDQLLSNNSMFVGLMYEEKSLALRAHDLIFTNDLNNSLLGLICFLSNAYNAHNKR